MSVTPRNCNMRDTLKTEDDVNVTAQTDGG